MSATTGSTARPGYSRRSPGAVWFRKLALTSIGTYRLAVPEARIALMMIRLFSALPAPELDQRARPQLRNESRHPVGENAPARSGWGNTPAGG